MASILIGYARVSTDDQRLDLQNDALTKAGVDERYLFQEYISGTRAKRPELEACLRTLRPGDTLVVWRLDRLGRRLSELVEIMEWLKNHDVHFRSLTESIDTSSAVGHLIFHVLAAIAQFERDLISERTKAGLAAARARGNVGGRKPALSKAKIKAAWKLRESSPDLTQQEVADTFNVSRATLYRSFAKHGYEITHDTKH